MLIDANNDMNIEQLSDNDLVALFVYHKDADAFGVLYKRYALLVYGLAYKYFRNEHLAKDAVSDIFLKIHQAIKEKQPDYFDRWLYTVAKNHIFSILRKGNQITTDEIPENNLEEFMEFEEEERLFNNKDSLDVLNDAISNLNIEQQQCIRYFYFEQKSYHEVALLTQFDIKKVKSCIQNGKRNLKIYLDNKNTNHEAL